MTKMEEIFSFDPEAIIVDAGQFPSSPIPLGLMDCGVSVVCCDGAAVRYLESGRLPWRIVGDGDSLPKDLQVKVADIIRKFPDQDTNDQTKAVRYLDSKGITKIAIVGATGLREDHTLGNISLLIDYMRQGMEVRIYTDYGMFIPCEGDCRIECNKGTQVSIFNFGATSMYAEGLRYPIRDFDSWWQGTLNETLDTQFTIHARGEYLLFLTYPSASGKNPG